MATFGVLLSLCTYILHVTSQYNNFTDLGIMLPTKLQQHIAAVYNNKLYVFGGKNDTLFTESFSTRYYSLDLSQINLVLSSSNNDIDSTVLDTSVQWQQLQITHPSYGPSTTGVMRCIHQCSVLIDKYLYIVAPYGASEVYTSYVYRLDLSLDPPVFSGEDDFASRLPLNIKEPCITSAHNQDLIYSVGGDQSSGGTQADDIFLQYNISNEDWSYLPSMNKELQSGGCAVSNDDSEVYIFGGKSFCASCTSRYGSKYIDTYSVNTGIWTDNDLYSSPVLPQVTFDIKCVSNSYDESIICPGGVATRAYDKAIIYRTPVKSIIDTIYLAKDTAAYATASYEFINDVNDQARILLIIGGHNADLLVYDSIQYLVQYNIPTNAPTAAPSIAPTSAPSSAPTAPPSNAPSYAPSQPPSSSPSFSPTETQMTTGETPAIEGSAAEKTTENWGEDNSASDNIGILWIYVAVFSVCGL